MPRRFRFVDALRGIAFLSVLIGHLMLASLPFFLNGIYQGGGQGVELFFIVSAFTLFYSLQERSKRERRPVRNFFIRRFFRIAPMFWFAIAVSLFVDGFSPRHDAQQGITGFDVVRTIFFLHGWWPNSINSVVRGDWTIAAEMTFYCLLPLAWRYLRNLSQSLWLVLISLPLTHLLSLGVRQLIQPYYPYELYNNMAASFVYYWLPAQIPVLSLGIVLYFILKDHLAQPSAPLTKETIGLSQWMLALAAYLILAAPFGGYWYIPGHFVFAMGYMFLALSLALNPVPLLVNKFTCYLGKISYSSYLVHFFVIRFINYLEYRFGVIGYSVSYPGSYYLARLLVALAFTMAVASITYYAIEVPGIALGKRIINRWEKHPAPQPAAGTNW